jgi:hypothetical protein
MERLKRNQISAEADDKLKDIAENYKLNPIDLLKVILVEGYSLK